jgi:ABC-type spermidine/putrescine transport system permease subunit II
VRLGVTPEINAVSAILIGMVAVIMVGGYLVGLGKARKS